MAFDRARSTAVGGHRRERGRWQLIASGLGLSVGLAVVLGASDLYLAAVLIVVLISTAAVWPRVVMYGVTIAFAAADRGVTLQYRVWLGSVPASPLDLLAIAMVVAVVSLILRKRRLPHLKLIVPLLIVMVAAALVAGFAHNAAYFVLQDLRIYAYSVLFFVAFSVVSSERTTVRRLAAAMLGGLALLATLQIAASAAMLGFRVSLPALLRLEPGPIYRPVVGSLTGMFQDNLLTTQRVLLLWGVALAMLTIRGRRAPRWTVPAVMLAGGAILLSLQRSVWLAAALILVLVMVRPGLGERRKKLGLVVLGGSVVVLLVALVPDVGATLLARFQQTVHPFSTVALEYRQRETAAVLRRMPPVAFLIGRGLGATVAFVGPASGQVVVESSLHDQFLFFIFKSGLTGLLAALLPYLLLRHAWRSADGVAYGLMAGVLGLLVISAVGGGLGDYAIAPLMLAAAVLARARSRLADRLGDGSHGRPALRTSTRDWSVTC